MAHTTNIIDVNEATFEQDVIQNSSKKTVVVDFWAAWCGPCRMLGPVLERLAEEPGSNFVLAKVDVDANPGLAMRFGVQGIPAVKAFRDGRVAGEFVGAKAEPQVRQFLNEVAPAGAGNETESVDRLMQDRRWSEAAELYRESLDENPADFEARLGLAQTLIGQGQGCKAKVYLADLQNEAVTMTRAETLMPLADFICSLAEKGDQNAEVTIVEAQYRQAARLFSQGKIAPAMDGLLDVLRHNKDYRDGQVKLVMLGVFELLGDEDPLTGAYRREMASILF
jgi:putative thioredoxin